MQHLGVLFNLLSLFAGILCLARIASRYLSDRRPRWLAFLAFFASFTYLMLVGASFSYWLVNIESSEATQYAFAGMVFLGMAALELSIPAFIASGAGTEPAQKRGKARLLPAACAACTGIQAPLVWIGAKGSFPWLNFAFAFLPFIGIAAWLAIWSLRRRREKQPLRKILMNAALYAAATLLVAWDLWNLNHFKPGDRFVALSLPAFYALTTWRFLSVKTPEAARGNGLPDSLSARLTPREQDMVRLILEGRGNKEIASELGLSGNTVRNHIYNLYQKLGIQKRMDLIRLIREDSPESGT